MNTKIKLAGRVAHNLLDEIGTIIRYGISTEDINNHAETVISGCYPECTLACKNYKGFPKSICTSINEEIIHGIPSSEKNITNWDLVKVDLVVEYQGWYADTARTFIVGKGNKLSRKLVKTTRKALYEAIKIARPGSTTGDIGYLIQQYANKAGFSVMKKYGGHGIGTKIHTNPFIPCYGTKGSGETLKEGMIITIEPMLFVGNSDIETGKDGWTVKSKDNSLTAHFEHTILITKNKPLIIT